MAQARRANVTHTNRIKNQNTNAYVYGNTVRRLDVRHEIEQAPRRQLSHEARKNRDKAHHMSFGYVLFLMAALFTAGMILIQYIQLQSDITTKNKLIARMETQLNDLRQENDDTLARIENSIDFEEIKRVAIGELGMTYAQDGQIILYTNSGNDYMHRVSSDIK